jgi:hypothetical protein
MRNPFFWKVSRDRPWADFPFSLEFTGFVPKWQKWNESCLVRFTYLYSGVYPENLTLVEAFLQSKFETFILSPNKWDISLFS